MSQITNNRRHISTDTQNQKNKHQNARAYLFMCVQTKKCTKIGHHHHNWHSHKHTLSATAPSINKAAQAENAIEKCRERKRTKNQETRKGAQFLVIDAIKGNPKLCRQKRKISATDSLQIEDRWLLLLTMQSLLVDAKRCKKRVSHVSLSSSQ